MWFQLALSPEAPLLNVLVGIDNLLYFRILDIANLLGKKNGTIFAKRFKCDIILGFNVLPPTQTYPKRVAGAHLVTRDTTARIIRHENLELAKKFSNALDTGCAYVQSKRIFASSYKQSPKLFVVNTPNENTVKVAQWIREFTMDLKLQRKRDIKSLRQYMCSISPNMLQPRIDDAETAGENDVEVVSNGENVMQNYEENVKQEVNHDENVMQNYEENVKQEVNHADYNENVKQEVNHDENVMQDYDENVMQDYDENVMQDYEENVKQEVNHEVVHEVNHGETTMEKDDVNNGRVDVGENSKTTEATDKNQNNGRESLFQMMTESSFKSYFNNKHDSSEIFTQIPQTIHFTRALNSRIMLVVPDE
ncbi:hypothetical protein TNCV_200451 [Trichonephila clavipes]|nr:hypothetical protein TNCV_200451 [Trichonephila clavipes]